MFWPVPCNAEKLAGSEILKTAKSCQNLSQVTFQLNRSTTQLLRECCHISNIFSMVSTAFAFVLCPVLSPLKNNLNLLASFSDKKDLTDSWLNPSCMKIKGSVEIINPKISSALGRDCQGSLAGSWASPAKQRSVVCTHRTWCSVASFCWSRSWRTEIGAELLPGQGDPGEGLGQWEGWGGEGGKRRQGCKESGFISSSVYGCGELGPCACLGFIASDGRLEIIFPVEKKLKKPKLSLPCRRPM